ncbi:hypothetical protein JCM5353_001348 [Sporobolomyces roseus]
MVEAEVVEENEPSQIMLADNSSRYDAPPPFAIPSHPRPLDSQSNCSSSDPALFVYRFTLPAASLLSLLIGCRGTTVKRTSEQAGVVIHYHGSFEPPYSLFSPPSPTPPHGIIQGDVYGIKCALDYIKLDLQRSNCTYSREQALCSNLDFLEFDPQKLEHLTEKNKLSPPNNRRSSNDSGHGWRESRSERRTSDTGFAAQAYDESESLGPPPSRTRTVSPQAYRSNPARALFSRPLDNSPSLSSQSSAYPVNQQFTSRQSPSPIRKKLSIRRQRSRSPSPARPYSSRRPSKSQSPPRRPCQASSRPSLSISTAYQESESQNREIEEENKKGRSKMSSKTKQEQKSFAFEIPLIAIPSFYGPQSSLPHLERISQSKLKLECETTSARLVVLASDGTVKNFEKLKNGIEDVVRIAEGCENWSIRGKEEDQEMSPPAATSSLDAESGTYRFPSPISLQPQSRNAESRPRSLSHSRSRSTSVTAQTSRRSEDAPMRGREQVERSMSCDRLRNERGKRTATKLESRPEDEKRGRRRSRSQNWSGARRGRDRSRSKDRLVEKRARSRSPKSTYSSITPQNGRYGSVGFERSAPRQTPIASRSPARTALPHLTSQSSRPRRMSPARLDSPPHHSAILSRPPPPSSASYPSHDEPKFAPPSSITNYIGQPIHLTLNEEDRRRGVEMKERDLRKMKEGLSIVGGRTGSSNMSLRDPGGVIRKVIDSAEESLAGLAIEWMKM